MSEWAARGRSLFSLLALAVAVCAAAADRGPGVESPPAELLQSNFGRAAIVLVVSVVDVSAVKEFRADAGTVGYTVYLVRTRPVKCYKGATLLPSEFEYRFTQETGASAHVVPAAGGPYLVFLKREPKTGEWWVLAEGAQFLVTPELEKMTASWRPSAP